MITGFNAATVGVIALAAVFLSKKAITDKLSRILVFLGATAGILHNALWYFPVLMIGGGLATIVWDLKRDIRLLRGFSIRTKKRTDIENPVEAIEPIEPKEVSPKSLSHSEDPVELAEQSITSVSTPLSNASEVLKSHNHAPSQHASEGDVLENVEFCVFSWRIGVAIIVVFFMTFITTIVLRTVLKHHPRGLDLFANLYLAGEFFEIIDLSPSALTPYRDIYIWGRASCYPITKGVSRYPILV